VAVQAAKASLVVAALVLACAATGCGHIQKVGGDRTMRVALTEYRLSPQNFRARPGTLAIQVRNYGRLTHNLVVSLNGQTVGGTRPIPPGQSTKLDLYLTPGSYTMASTILSDQALGQYGTLTVK
jgi:hypothetical protein